jgi:2-polyprenyl-6-hydroxyphenyl methylase/3-demethylubiquinone-9 3-methyltransferase
MHANLDSNEIAKFDAIAARWWDPEGEFRPLHAINPLRLDYVDSRAPLKGRRVLDIGCGGGLLAEGMAERGAKVTGIDLSEGAIKVAKLHLKESGRQVDYRLVSAEAMAAEMPGAFDLVTCLEMLEHVPDPASIVAACSTLVRPGGQVIFSTLNRNPKAFALAILGGEYLLAPMNTPSSSGPRSWKPGPAPPGSSTGTAPACTTIP